IVAEGVDQNVGIEKYDARRHRSFASSRLNFQPGGKGRASDAMARSTAARSSGVTALRGSSFLTTKLTSSPGLRSNAFATSSGTGTTSPSPHFSTFMADTSVGRGTIYTQPEVAANQGSPPVKDASVSQRSGDLDRKSTRLN